MASTAIVKVIKNKTGFMLALLLMMLMGAGPAVAKTEPGDKKEKAPTEKKKKSVTVNKSRQLTQVIWYYNASGTTEGDFKTATNWSTANDPDDSDCFTTGNRPCQISVEATNNSQLQTYLTGLGSTSVLSVSSGRKP